MISPDPSLALAISSESCQCPPGSVSESVGVLCPDPVVSLRGYEEGLEIVEGKGY